MKEQAVQHIGGVLHLNVDDPGVKWRILIRDMSIELHTRIVAVLWICAARSFGTTAGPASSLADSIKDLSYRERRGNGTTAGT